MLPNDSVFAFLHKHKVDYQLINHPAIEKVKEADFAIPGLTVKNLLLKTQNNHYYLLVIAGDKRADLKSIATQLSEKRLSFASPELMKSLMKLTPGTVSPFGLLNDENHQVQVVVDESLNQNQLLGFHPNVNHQTIMVSFSDFINLIEAMGNQYRLIK